MRTKTLLTAAALAAGALTAMAQSNVYSLNVVGYYNTPLGAGFTLVANQLDTGTNGINQVVTTAGLGDEVLTFANNAYVTDIYDGGPSQGGVGWLDNNTGNPSLTVLPPGKGFFYYNVNSPITETFVGQVQQGSLNLLMPAGFALLGTRVPAALNLNSNNFPQVLGMELLTFANNSYVTYINDGGPSQGGSGWLDNNTGNPVALAPAVGQGYYIYNSDPTTYTWTLNFTVQ